MSDQRLRELERAVARGEAKGRELLMERLRTGHLDAERVELAAWCGHPDARAIMPGAPSEPCCAGGCGKPLLAHPIREGRCTGVSAFWCPECGDCACRDVNGEALDGLCNPICPLHCPGCIHAGPDQRFNTLCVGWPSAQLLVAGLARLDLHVWVRAAAAAGRVALPIYEMTVVIECPACMGDGISPDSPAPCPRCTPPREVRGNGHLGAPPEPRRAIEATEAWLACPCEEHRRAAASEVDIVPAPDDSRAWWALPVAALCSWAHPEVCAEAVRVAARIAGELPVRAAISSALIAWALA